MIPLHSAARELLAWWLAAQIERNGNLRIVRFRRGCIKRAYLRDDDPAILQRLIAERQRSGYGAGFQQHLECGKLAWALIMAVRGSRRGAVVLAALWLHSHKKPPGNAGSNGLGGTKNQRLRTA